MTDWTWSSKKARQNLKNHKVSFELAKRALDDPLALTQDDPYPYEQRYQTLCQPSASSHLLLFVVHTCDEETDTGRIISARKADPSERRAYEGR
ncbi:MAG TPA: BrnT family toxin [Rhodospirillaceae bacterium]|nr:BrnT family toxin [Rhodospirillaceae bacterium]